jgi:hypothetical protein
LLIRKAATVLALALLSGCYSHRAVTGPAPLTETVRVRFAEPRAVRFQQGGDSSTVPGVRELRGTVFRQTTDSLWLVVQRVGDAGPFEPGVTVVVERTPGTTIHVRRLSTIRTAAAVVGGGVVLFIGVFLLVLSGFE